MYLFPDTENLGHTVVKRKVSLGAQELPAEHVHHVQIHQTNDDAKSARVTDKLHKNPSPSGVAVVAAAADAISVVKDDDDDDKEGKDKSDTKSKKKLSPKLLFTKTVKRLSKPRRRVEADADAVSSRTRKALEPISKRTRGAMKNK